MKRLTLRLTALILFSVSALSLCACHHPKEISEFYMPAQFDGNVHYEITFWAKNDSNKNQVAIYEKAIADFEALYPNITVTMRRFTDYAKIYNEVITNISTGTTPNVCITYPDHIATYITGENTVAPLDKLMADKQYGLGGSALRFDGPSKDEIVPAFYNECLIDGVCYAVPFMRSTEACYINRDLVEKLGYEVPDVLTWDFVREVIEKAVEMNHDGFFNENNKMIPFIYKSTDNMMITLLRQYEGGYSDAGGGIYIDNSVTKDILAAVNETARKKAFSTFAVSGYPGNFLNAGECIFAVDSTAGSTWMGSDAPLSDIHENKIVSFTTEVRPVPQADPGNPLMISQGPSICVFNKEDSGEVLASWLFVQYLLTNEVQIAYSETEGYLPVTTKALNSGEYAGYLADAGIDSETHYKVKIDCAKLLLENLDNTFVTPVFNGSASLRKAAGQMIEDAVKAANRNQTVDFGGIIGDEIKSNHLDTAQSQQKREIGSLPAGSKALLWSLFAVWVLIGVYAAVTYSRKKTRAKKKS